MEIQPESTRKRICATYAGDMHALELHMLEAFERQLSITKEYHDAHNVVLALVSTSKYHAETLHHLVSSLGDVEKIVTDKLKSAVAGLFGFAAGIVDTVRPLAASKALRDSYTAIHHAIVGYVMLSTTAVALNNDETRIIADKFLNDWVCLSRRVMCVIPCLTLRDLRDEDIQICDLNAARKIKENKQWSLLFQEESSDLPHEKRRENLHPIGPNLSQPLATTTLLPFEKASGSHTVSTFQVDTADVSKVMMPVIVEETFRPEKIIEVQPVIHREIRAPEVHHIERHFYEKVESAGPSVITNKPIIEEVIKPQITEEVQEIIHRDLPAPFIEKVEKLTDELEVMPTLYTNEVILEKGERVVVKNATENPTTVIDKTEKMTEVKTTTPGFSAGGPRPKGSARKKAH